MLCIASCSLNKDSLLNDNKADNNYAKHLAHSGKFGRCSLCNNLALASQSTDSAVMPLAVQPEEQEQIFASNAAQENIILKPRKFILNTIANENKIVVYSSSKKLNKHNIKKLIESKDKKIEIKSLLIQLLILTLAILLFSQGVFSEGAMELLALVVSFAVIYGIVKLLKLTFQAIKETPKGKKIYWFLVPILIIPALFILLLFSPLLSALSPFAYIYGKRKLFKSGSKEKSAMQKLGMYLFFSLTLLLMALIPFFIYSIMGLAIANYIFFLVPLFFLIAPITLIYLIVKAIKSRKVKKGAKQKAEIFAILGLILAIMTLVFVIGTA